jgi:hypothetical protein
MLAQRGEQTKKKTSAKPTPTSYKMSVYQDWKKKPENKDKTLDDFQKWFVNLKEKDLDEVAFALANKSYDVEPIGHKTLTEKALEIKQGLLKLKGEEPSEQGKQLSVEKAKEYLKKAKGNRKAAEAMARKDGYVF